MSDSFPSNQVGPWRLLSLLGEGGMGSVWLAERADGAFQRQVALKVMRSSRLVSNLSERFVTERQTLAELDHPGIARLIDGGETEAGLPYLVMDYVQGEPLDEYCRKQQPNLEQRLTLFLAICDAVQYAHQRLVVHRDLKPANIMVNDAAQPVLLDFGIAKLLPGHRAANLVETLDHERIMTPRYAAPEQIEGKAIGTGSDVYALGVILYELLSGASPYAESHSGDVLALARSVLETDTVPPSNVLQRADVALRPPDTRLSRRLQGDLDTIVLKALRKEPQRRYASVEQFANDLRRYLAGLPVSARADTLGYRTRKFLVRNRWPVASGVAVLVALSVGLAAAMHEAAEAQRQRLLAEQQQAIAEQAVDSAQQRYDQVRALSNTLLSEVDELLELTPGTTLIRQRLIEQSLSYLDLLSDEDSDPVLQAELAAGYARLADLMANPYSPNLADLQRGRDMAADALALRRELHAQQPDSLQATLDLAASLDQNYVINTRETALDKQREHHFGELLDEAQALLDALPVAAHAEAAFVDTMLRLLERQADRRQTLGDYAGAVVMFRALLEQIHEYRTRYDIDELLVDRREAIARSKLSNALWWEESDVEAALAQAQAALDRFQQLADRQPANLRAQRERSIGLLGLARILGYEISAEQAEPLFREAVANSRRLLMTDPDNAQLQRDLSLHKNGLGVNLLALQRIEEGVELLQGGERLLSTLAENNPQRAEVWAELALSRCGLVEYIDDSLQDPQWEQARCRHARGCLDARERARQLGLGLEQLDRLLTLARAQRVACRERGID